ncbi:DA1-related 4 protein [Nymphaea thermarum]|nr:DA1-related 4 protein [Nymphaea thermarum]
MYADSIWCLMELADIVKCNRLIIPVFVHVNPVDVQKQEGTDGSPLPGFTDRFGAKKVNEWKEALRVAGNAPGFTLDDDRLEASLLISLGLAGCQIGQYLSWISIRPGNTQMRSSLARAPVLLPEPLVSDIDEGKNAIKEKVSKRSVFIVLDDVSDKNQLDALVGDKNWFRPGSRIIITTEDDSFLDANMHMRYSLKELDNEEALQLFCYHAFGKMAPPEEYFRLSKQAVALCHGLPKALEKLGSFLSYKKSEEEWDDALNKLERSPPDAILDLARKKMESVKEEDSLAHDHNGKCNPNSSVHTYASERCLTELGWMVEQRRLIFPVFFDVNPSDVRRQKGALERHFRRHDERLDREMVSGWKKALEEVGGTKGYDLTVEESGSNSH